MSERESPLTDRITIGGDAKRVRVVMCSDGYWYAARYDGSSLWWHTDFERVVRVAIRMAYRDEQS